jgi:hypothetical protein
LDQALNTIISAIELVIKTKDILSQPDQLYLIIDDTILQGFIFEEIPEIVASIVLLKDDKAFSGKSSKHGDDF